MMDNNGNEKENSEMNKDNDFGDIFGRLFSGSITDDSAEVKKYKSIFGELTVMKEKGKKDDTPLFTPSLAGKVLGEIGKYSGKKIQELSEASKESKNKNKITREGFEILQDKKTLPNRLRI